MSTLTSADMNITRSSTRLHAPPGGHTSISFGDSDPVPKIPKVTAEPPVNPPKFSPLRSKSPSKVNSSPKSKPLSLSLNSGKS